MSGVVLIGMCSSSVFILPHHTHHCVFYRRICGYCPIILGLPRPSEFLTRFLSLYLILLQCLLSRTHDCMTLNENDESMILTFVGKCVY